MAMTWINPDPILRSAINAAFDRELSAEVKRIIDDLARDRLAAYARARMLMARHNETN